MEKFFTKKFWATTFTLTGTIIGAGILGLPYVFSQSGFWIGMFWLIFLGIIMIYVSLCLGETVLRTKKDRQLPGLAKKYLGKTGQFLMFFAVIFGIYSALLAYLIGESQSLSMIFTGSLDYSIYFAIGFWLLMTIGLREGLKGLKKVETWGVLAILTIILIITISYLPKINYENLTYINLPNFFLPFGVVLFALLGFASIPELELEIKGKEKKLKRAIILGVLIPIIVYAIFSFIFVGVLGSNVPQVATLGLGKLVILLGIFTMLTSYFALSFALKDVFKFDLNLPPSSNLLLISIIPILAYLILYFFNFLSFIMILGIGGVISGGITAILILFIAKNAKTKGNRKPEYEIPINYPIIIFLSLIFVLGIIFELFF